VHRDIADALAKLPMCRGGGSMSFRS
jgi:hypothetical protein